MTAAMVIGVALAAAAALAFWALGRQAAHLDQQPTEDGKGNATASGSPGQNGGHHG